MKDAIVLFGQSDCVKCTETKNMVNDMFDKFELKDVDYTYWDLETVDGMAEGAFNDVLTIPTTKLCRVSGNKMEFVGDVPDRQKIIDFFKS